MTRAPKGGRTSASKGAITDKVTEVVLLGPRLYHPATTPLRDAETFVAGRHEDFPGPVAQLKRGLS